MSDTKKVILNGMRDGLPIGLGYYAVSFSLGIIAKKAGLTPVAGFVSSLFTRASAGEYGGYTTMIANASYVEMFVICLITNLRYLLMNTALTQKFDKATSMLKRILVGICCTDEIFGISIAYEGNLNPLYPYAATIVAGTMWALGTASGIVAGNILPDNVVAALSVALYGMFVAIVIPAGKKDKAVLAAIIVSFAMSFVASKLPVISSLSAGTRTIILTVVISVATAIIRPIEEDDNENS